MDQVVVSTSAGLYGVDVDSGNLSYSLNDSHASIVCPVGTVGQGGVVGTRLICCPQLPKGLIHYWRLGASNGQPESSGNAVYKCSTPEKFSALTFSSCGGLMFAGCPSGSIYVWQTYTGALVRSWTAHFGQVTKLVLSRDDSMLFSASEDSTVKQYFVPNLFADSASPVPEPEAVFSGHSGKINDICLVRDSRLVTASSDKSVKIFGLEKNRDQLAHYVCESEPTKVAAIDTEVYYGCMDGSIHSVNGGAFLGTHTRPITGLGLSLDGSRLVSCADGVKVWDSSSLVLVRSVIGPNQQLKDCLGLSMLRKPIVVPDEVEEAISAQAMGGLVYVSPVDTYLQLKPLQRTLTRVDTIDMIPLIRTVSTHGSRLSKVKNGILINRAAVEEGAVAGDPLAKAQSEILKLREHNKMLTQAFSDAFARLVTLTEHEPELALPVSKKQKN